MLVARITPILLVSVVASLPAQQATSVNFRGNGGSSVTAAAGVPSAPSFASWNNVNAGAGTNVVLLDEASVDQGTRLTFASASGGYQLNPAASSQDGRLFDGQIIATVGGGPATVAVTGVPYGSYDVYVYVGHGPAHAGRDVQVQLGGGTFAYRNDNLQLYTDPIAFQQVTSTSVPGQLGNYVVFTGETASSFTLTLQPATTGTPGSSGIAGLQIVDRGVDTDGDGLPDNWEMQWFGNLLQTATGDPDADQLANLGEFQNATVPIDSDSDDDMSTDGAEILRGTDPLDPDSDDDQLLDGVETDTYVFVSATDTGTDPLVLDTDGDGPRDGAEVRRGSNPCDPNSLPDLPNVIVIMADDLGWGELGSYGQSLITTPNLDQLAQAGMRFTQFYSGSPVCAPTRCTIQTGKHTGHCEIRNNSASAALDPDTFTFGRMMQIEGYTTACIGKWGNGDVGTTGHPNLQGYDHFFGFVDQVHAHWYFPSYLWRNGQQVLYPSNNGTFGPSNAGTVHAQDEMTREALQWLDTNHARPFFLYLAYTVPHVSLQEPPHSDPLQAALGLSAIDELYPNINWSEPNANFASNHYTSNARPRAAYAAMISAMDRDIGLVMQKLVSYGIEDDTLVVFTSDNGTTYCCGVDRQFFNSLAGLRGYKGEVYEGGLRVPTIAHWPGKIAPATVTSHVAAVWDLLPTVADLIDAEVPNDLDGVSFLPTLTGQPTSCQEQHEYLYWEYAQGGRRKAVRMGDYKGVRYGDAGAGVQMQLFDLANDPNETTNIAAQQPGIVAQIERIMASRHTYEPQFYRGLDEFPVVNNVTLANANPYLQLDSGGLGSVECPLVRDTSEPMSLRLTAQMQNVAGRLANISLLLGDAAAASQTIVFELDAQQAVYRISSPGALVTVGFGNGVNPYEWFDVVCSFDPSTGLASMSNHGLVVASGQMVTTLAQVSFYGYRVDNARTLIAPLDPALAERFRASWTPFGGGCVGTAGTPMLRAMPASLPFTSSCFEVEVFGIPPSQSLVFGVMGLSDSWWNGQPLPQPLAAIGMPSCSLHVSLDVAILMLANQGRAVWPLPIPGAMSLHGYRFHQQAVVFDPTANVAGFVVSNAGTGVVGGR